MGYNGYRGGLYNKGGSSAPLVLAGGVVTASSPVITVTETWNNAGVVFTGILENITDTASAAGSLLIDLQVGGITKFKVDKLGALYTVSLGDYGNPIASFHAAYGGTNFFINGQSWFRIESSGISYDYRIPVGWGTGNAATTRDVGVGRNAVGVMEVNDGTTLGVFRDLKLRNLSATGGTVTVSTPVVDLTQTWNAGAVVFTAKRLNITDTASAAGSLLLDLQVGSVSKASIRKDGLLTVNALTLFDSVQGTASVVVTSNSWSFTGTVAANSGVNWSNGWGVLAGGTGNVTIRHAGSGDGFLTLSGGNGVKGVVASSGVATQVVFAIRGFAAQSGNLQEWRNSADTILAYVTSGGDFIGGGNVLALQGAALGWAGYGFIRSSSDGVFKLSNNAETGFSKIQFGGTTNLFPALQRTGATVRCELADGSGFANFVSGGYYFGALGSLSALIGDGIFCLRDVAGTSFGRLQFGGTTNAFPSIRRNGTQLDFRLADDTNYTNTQALYSYSNSSISVAAAPTVVAGQISYGGTTATTIGANGAASALTALPVGYIIINVAGTQMKVPYYNT